MKRTLLFLAAALLLSASAFCGEIPVGKFRHSGPYPVKTPFIIDSLNVNSKAFRIKDILESSLPSSGKEAQSLSGDNLPSASGEDYAVGSAKFSFSVAGYAKVKIEVEADAEGYVVFLDGKKAQGETALDPGTHEAEIRYMVSPGKAPSLKAKIVSADEGKISVEEGGKHFYGMKDVLLGTRISSVQLSPKGDYTITSYTRTLEGGRTESFSELTETATGRLIRTFTSRMSWMPTSNLLWTTLREPSGTKIVTTDPATGAESIFADNIPDGGFSIAPSEDFLIYTMSEEGPRENPDVYRILTPDDRQPGWRRRSYPAKYDLKTGVMQRLTWGYHSARISDISQDGKKALLSVSEERLEQRPTTLSTLYLMDLESLETEVLVEKDGFMQGAMFSPDCKSILLTGSPEAFGKIGMNVEDGQTPNTYDMQLYLMDLSSKSIKPLTKDFDPNVQSARWSLSDGNIYFTAENRDLYSLYRLNPKNGKITLLETSEELVKGFSIGDEGNFLAYFGQSASNSDRSYVMDLKSGKSTLRKDLSAEILKDVELGECHEWNFKNSKGETVYGRYYLPPRFDPSKKYPMIVNYYGGCSPTSRNFESRYPHHAYAALGYVVYVVAVPSGATGNGQKWSARHVNTAGDGPAQDIIEGTQQFCKEHSFVNEKKIGCIGASYGGFMSQYIPTLTDMFACSVSHAGISDHTSYWGFGYWGYSYSETSMANSYPWSDKELYVDHSPLYLADKINTPILFVHGDADTNVPFNESVQMFTAMKLLGKETAFVAVKDQNHHILDYAKRLKWQNTIWAWFAKYLQDDPTWWDALYPPVNL